MTSENMTSGVLNMAFKNEANDTQNYNVSDVLGGEVSSANLAGSQDAELNDEIKRAMDAYPAFAEKIEEVDPGCQFGHDALETLQVNVTRQCNLSCKHCHLECSPVRTECMSQETMQACLDVFTSRGFKSLDVTGGAPEMNPHLEWFLREAVTRDIPVMLRSNICIHEQDEYKHFPQLYADLGINVVASLPHYKKLNMERQRGADTFDAVIRGLQRLNSLGYGKGEAGANAEGKVLQLDLVFNPAGLALPPAQATMEAEYKRRLRADFGIEFDNLFAIANNPCGRFAKALYKKNKLVTYMNKLIGGFNAATVPNMMCRSEVSVAPDGTVYDCDFNQAQGLPCASGWKIADLLDKNVPLRRKITFGNHCYACTAGAGSSCGGATE